MSGATEVFNALKDVLLLTDKVERIGDTLSDISHELRDQDRRIIRLEVIAEQGGMRKKAR